MLAQTPVQIAWVTRDLDATEGALTSLLGAKKWVRMPGVHFGPETCTYRGEPADFVADISLSYAGATQLEVIAPGPGASVYTEFLDACGPGLHHVCVEVDDVAAALSERDAEVVARGVMPGGMEFAYVSAPAAGVPYLELAHIPDEIKSFFDYIKREQK
ncbi:Glyoxalase/Bleomycin resistance protein/Dioxygenase superfamily protein [Mycolicibacterium rutilum]|uniref:Glyoxalase/Bleomycin resistance protein/Dioxygenase superfamily protein n=1 Tax=Mycolicibacterium rutilum TaxID=370526 RepID=A0A1H6L3A5_MYCRU|nr:VOC family protein [Mycolicibacterium rutilum]SEH78831.1 Glyoxalase/Bleomycin resistance protein/Dioxygenase superfamily protein [Mycolicibacterium rutilum]